VSNPVAVLRRCRDGANEYDQLWFVCPGCARRREGDTGLHALPVHRAGQPRPSIARPSWEWDGNLEAPTLAPSILSRMEWDGVPFVCHSFLRAGVFQFLGDCTHDLATKQAPLPPLPDWFMQEG
jgi:hypothetical protein